MDSWFDDDDDTLGKYVQMQASPKTYGEKTTCEGEAMCIEDENAASAAAIATSTGFSTMQAACSNTTVTTPLAPIIIKRDVTSPALSTPANVDFPNDVGSEPALIARHARRIAAGYEANLQAIDRLAQANKLLREGWVALAEAFEQMN
jgi:hypothetical protein